MPVPDDLAAGLARFEPEAVGLALDRARIGAAARLAEGIRRYRDHPYCRGAEAARPIWSSGSAILLDHGTEPGVPALFIPSLINRGAVLDLVPGEGMLSWLASAGIRPLRLEWGDLDAEARRFAVADYVTARLEPALEAAVAHAGGPVVLVGYCMGGILTLMAALRRPALVSALVLLASPWDFHAEAKARAEAVAAVYGLCRPAFRMLDEMPVEALQGLFAMLDPAVAIRKFQRFARVAPDSMEARWFVALEDWINDGVPLALGVADDALSGWYRDNGLVLGSWRPHGAPIDPAALDRPTLVVVPGSDRIVPPASAAAILPRLRRAARMDPPLGHIGMVVGRRAPEALWRPLAAWIREHGAAASRPGSKAARPRRRLQPPRHRP